MNDAIKAIKPGEQLYQLGRIHSKLVNICRNETALADSEYPPATILVALDNLKIVVACLGEKVGHSKEFREYIFAIEQCTSVLQNYLNKVEHFNNMGETIFYMEGRYNKFRSYARKQLNNGCLVRYHNLCVPVFHLDKLYD